MTFRVDFSALNFEMLHFSSSSKWFLDCIYPPTPRTEVSLWEVLLCQWSQPWSREHEHHQWCYQGLNRKVKATTFKVKAKATTFKAKSTNFVLKTFFFFFFFFFLILLPDPVPVPFSLPVPVPLPLTLLLLGSPSITTMILFLQCKPNSDAQLGWLMLARKARM